MKRTLAILIASAAAVPMLAASPAQAAGYCNGRIDYMCTDRGDGYTFCTLWINGCYIGL